jgi:hypothetical protein
VQSSVKIPNSILVSATTSPRQVTSRTSRACADRHRPPARRGCSWRRPQDKPMGPTSQSSSRWLLGCSEVRIAAYPPFRGDLRADGPNRFSTILARCHGPPVHASTCVQGGGCAAAPLPQLGMRPPTKSGPAPGGSAE